MPVDIEVSNLEKPGVGRLKRGEVIAAKDLPCAWGTKQYLPNFVHLICQTLDASQVRPYIEQWIKTVSYTVLEHNPATDYYRVEASAAQVSTALDWGVDYGRLARADVEAFLANWNLSVVSTAPNSVIFEGTIYQALTSPGFWDNKPVGNIAFQELSYDSVTGIHRVQADYNLTTYSADTVEGFVQSHGANIVSHSNNIITIELSRNAVRSEFLSDVEEKTRKGLYISRYYVDPTLVDSAVSAGGTLEITQAQLMSALIDRRA